MVVHWSNILKRELNSTQCFSSLKLRSIGFSCSVLKYQWKNLISSVNCICSLKLFSLAVEQPPCFVQRLTFMSTSKRNSLLNLALVSFPVVRLIRGQEEKNMWSELLTSLFLHLIPTNHYLLQIWLGRFSISEANLRRAHFKQVWEAHLIFS